MNRTGSKILHGLLLATSGLVGSTLIASTAAMAGGGPTGGTVAVGSATIINASPTQTVVNQSSKKALINWNSFSIPTGSSVKFNQPNSKALAVNRVTGPNASTIDGQLLANGNVWLINANGVLFGKGSQINVGSLLATTSDLSDDDFKKGNYSFQSAANPNASVVNKGTITAGPGGSVILSAPSVSNEGLIHADLGTVVLGGANAFTVDMTGDNLLRYEITAPVADAPRDANGNPASALVSNSGTIMAAGGHVMMTARAARNIENNVINNTGMVEASTVTSHNGEIDLDAGPDGTVNDSGTLNAAGTAQAQTGGTVNVTGGTVNVADGANINVSGNAGGGSVQIGGGLHGQGTLAHAQRVVIGAATIKADATGNGNGGTVVVWSDGDTSFAGSISAKGGPQGGNGGQVETSGHNLSVDPAAKVDTTAPLGLTGDWLLDPTDILITQNTNGSNCCGTTCIAPSTIVGALTSTDVSYAATDTLIIEANTAPISYNSTHSLTLQAGTDLTIGSSVTNGGTGTIEFDAGNSIFINAAVSTLGSLYLHAGDFGVCGSGAGTGAILDAGGFSLTADTIRLTNDKGGTSDQTIGTASAPVNVSANHLAIATAADDIFITSPGGGFDIGDGFFGIYGNNITLTAAGSITQTSSGNEQPISATGIVNITTTGTGNGITLTDAANSFGTAGVLLNTQGNASLSGTGDTVIGVHEDPDDTPPNFVVGGNLTVVITDGGLTLAGRIHANGVGITTLESDGDLDNDSNGDGTIIADNLNLISSCGSIGAGPWSFGLGAPGTDTLNLHASAFNDITINPGDLNIGTSQGGLSAGGNILIFGNGAITQDAGANGTIVAGSIDFHALSDITLNNPLNAVDGVAFTTTGDVSFVDSTSMTVNALKGVSGVGMGNVWLAANGSLTVADGAEIDPSGNIMLVATGAIDIESSIQNPSSGDITLVAGADPSLLNVPTDVNSILTDDGYGNFGGSITIGGATTGNVAVGSESGATTILGADIKVAGDVNSVTGKYAQIGYHGTGGGDIVIFGTGNLTMSGNTSQTGQIGNGGFVSSGIGTGGVTGDITVTLSGNITDNSTANRNWIGNVAKGGSIESGDVTLSMLNGSFNGNDIKADLGGASGTGGNVFLGFTSSNDTTFDGFAISYNSANSLTVAAAGNLLVDGNLQNSGTGAINLIGGWNGSTVDGSLFTDPSTYGIDGNGVTFGSETNNVAVGGKGLVTVEGGNIELDGGSFTTQLGYAGTGGGDITIRALDTLTLNGGEGSSPVVQIGNGATFGSAAGGGNVSINAGSISTSGSSDIAGNSASLSTFGGDIGSSGGPIDVEVNYLAIPDAENDGSAADAFISSNGPISVGYGGHGIQLNGGDLTLSAGGAVSQIAAIIAGGANITATGGDITLDSGNNQIDNATLSATTGNVTLYDGASLELNGATVGGNFTVLTTGDLTITDSVQLNSGSLVAIAGWDGHTTDLASLTGSGAYGVGNQGNVTISGDRSSVSVGSASGSVLVEGFNVAVNANGNVTANPNGGYAQIGYNGGGTGNITVNAQNDVMLYASDDDQCDACYAQIGNGGFDLIANAGGDISVHAGGNVSLTGGAVDTSYAQIGNGGSSFDGTIGGNVTVQADGTVALTAGDGAAQIGNGGSYFDGTISGDVTVQADGTVTLTGGEGFAQIGNGGIETNGEVSGNITVLAGDDITLSAGDGAYGYAQIGNGGDSSTSANSGDIVVNTTGAVSLTGGNDYAQIGNGGYQTNGGDGNITVTAGSDITLTSGSEYAQIGNGGQNANGGTGDIVVTSGGSILLDGGFDYAEIGNGGFSTADDAIGNITVSAAANLTLTGGEGASQIGNGGGGFFGNVTGDIAIKVNGTTSISTAGRIGNYTESGNASGNVSIITGSGYIGGQYLVDDLQNGNVLLGWTGGDIPWDGFDYNSSHTLSILGTGNVDVQGDISNSGTGAINLVAGWDGHTTSLPSLTNTGVFGQNLGSVTIDGNYDDITVGSAGGTTTVLGYDVDLIGGTGSAQIGYRGTSTGNIVVRAAHDVVLTAGAGNINCCGCVAGDNDGFAQIGNGGAFVTGPDSGNITVSAANNVTLTGGSSTYGYASIGNGGDTDSHGDSGNIVVTAGGSVSLTGGVDYAQIGNGQWGSTDSSGNITVTAAQNITLTGANNSSWGYAQIGNGGQTADGNISGNIQVNAGGALTLAAGNGGMYAQIGNGGDKATTAGSKASGNISITAGSLWLIGSTSSAGPDSYVQLGNTAVFSTSLAGSGVASGNINVNVTGATTLTTTAGQGHVWIGNTAKGGSETGAVNILSGTFNSANENNDDIKNFVLADLAGGNLTIGVKSAGASLNIDDQLDYSSANNFTLLTAGNLTISGGIQNAGSGNILLVTGWNPNVAPANVLTTSGSYGNGNTGFSLGGSSATSDSMVGSALGTTTVLTKNLNISAVHDTAGLGFEGVATGNIVVNALGNIAVVGQGSNTFGIIGNLGIGNQAVSGNITIADSGSFTLTNGILSNFDLGNATVGGNVRLTASSLSASGASVLSGNSAAIALTGAGASVGSITNPLLTDVTAISVLTNNGSAYISAPQNGLSVGVSGTGINLGSGNLVLNAGGAVGQTAAIEAASLTVSAKNGVVTLNNVANAYGAVSLNVTGSFSASIVDTSDLTVGNVAVGGNLTVRTKGDLTFTKSIQLQNGSILAIAGWDGTATGATANGYGNNGGDIFIGGANAAGGVAIGSASGTTTLAAGNITLSATNGYAQVGYHGGGSGAINLLATGNVALNGGGSTGYFAQIGDGGYNVSGSSSEAISVIAAGDIGMNAGTGQEAYAQIGNGGAESNSNSSGYNETGLVTVSGKTITLAAGSGAGSYVQIGHGGYRSGQGLNGIATLGGNIAVNAVNAIRLIGGGVDGYAQIGQGGDFLNNGAADGSSGTISGDIAVAVATPNTHNGNDPLTLTAGSGVNSYAQIGNGGQGENIPAAGANGTFTIGGNVTVADLTLTGSNTGANGYAQIGNGDASKTGFGDVSGQVTLGQGTAITNVPGKAPGSSTGLGNATGTGTVTGTLPANSGVHAGTQGSVASINQNSTNPTNFNLTTVVVTPEVTLFNFSDKGTTSQGPSPLEQLADNSNSEGEIASDSVSQSVGESLGEGKTIYVTSKTLIPGMLKQIVTLTRNNPNGIPPADEDYSSWGNEALWRW